MVIFEPQLLILFCDDGDGDDAVFVVVAAGGCSKSGEG